MAKDVFRIPVHKKFLPKQNCSVYQIRLTLEVRTRTGAFVGMPFRFDTGSDFTTISMAAADRLGIPYSKTRPMFPTAVAGKTQHASCLSIIRFSMGQPKASGQENRRHTGATQRLRVRRLAEMEFGR